MRLYRLSSPSSRIDDLMYVVSRLPSFYPRKVVDDIAKLFVSLQIVGIGIQSQRIS